MAWRESDPGEVIVALDDDCEILDSKCCEQINDSLSKRARPIVSTSELHLNIIDLYDLPLKETFPRGYPYSARIDRPEMQVPLQESEFMIVTFSLGLWRGTFDVNAVDKIIDVDFVQENARLKFPSVIMAKGNLVSVCSMNMHFRREVIPAVFQFPMHVKLSENLVIDRYGDIWGGFILKLLMDKLDDSMSMGEPIINHAKNGEFLNNLWQENLAHMLNDEFRDIAISAVSRVKRSSYLEMMACLVEELDMSRSSASRLMYIYLTHLCLSMRAWCDSLAEST